MIYSKKTRLAILQLLAEGNNRKEIARILNKNHHNITESVRHMRNLIGAKTTVRLVVMFREGLAPKNFPFKQRQRKSK